MVEKSTYLKPHRVMIKNNKANKKPIVTVQPIPSLIAPISSRNQNRKPSMKPQKTIANIIMIRKIKPKSF